MGVTGLSRSGKTVFITSLIANLLDRGRMVQLEAAKSGRIEAAALQPQPDDTIPRFEYEKHLSDLTGPNPTWPSSTRSISQLRLSLRVQPAGLFGNLRGPKIIHIDIVDYPGEWLLDLPLLSQSYSEWSTSVLENMEQSIRKEASKDFRSSLEKIDPDHPLDEAIAGELAAAFTTYLTSCKDQGLSACAPGRFIMPGDLAGSPALSFAPMRADKPHKGTFAKEFERRFEAYKRKVVWPFFKNHFSRLDRQVILVDALGAINAGPQAVKDLRVALSDVLACFKTGRNGVLAPILGRKIDKILFAVTKADLVHSSQHKNIEAIMNGLVGEAKSKAELNGVSVKALAIASLRATSEGTVTRQGEALGVVKGRLADSKKAVAFYAGDLPKSAGDLLAATQGDQTQWLNHDYSVMEFLPAPSSLQEGKGPPHIRLDSAADFLFGDKL